MSNDDDKELIIGGEIVPLATVRRCKRIFEQSRSSICVGTSHFVNFTKACDYHKAIGYFEGDDWTPATIEKEIQRKIDEGEISIGQPEIKSGEKLSIIDDGTRYAIEN